MNDREGIPFLFPSNLIEKYGLLPSDLDPFGAYTGVPKEFLDMPIQDADDL